VWPDPFERWAALQASSTDASNRLDDSVDLAFWERVADDYGAGALAKRVPAVLERVRELVPVGSSLLDIGAGTGAFAIPLAEKAAHVTALDHSPAMLRVLRTNAPINVEPVLSRWEDAEIAPHDVALAANSLYRARDLCCALKMLMRVSRQRGIVVWSIGRQDAPQHVVREHVHPGRYRPGPDYVHLIDGLYAMDIFARVDIVEVDDTQHFGSDGEAIAALLSWQPITDDEFARATALLPYVLQRNASGWIWPRRGRIAIIWWDQPA
jgi:SAM-dependent methyltransferase